MERKVDESNKKSSSKEPEDFGGQLKKHKSTLRTITHIRNYPERSNSMIPKKETVASSS